MHRDIDPNHPLALAILIGNIGTVRAYQIASPAVVGTFDYSYLVFSSIWGILIFSETPDLSVIIGISLITLAGITVAHQSSNQ